MNIKKNIVSFIALTVMSVGAIQAADVSVSTDENTVILNGYDTVAYFTQSEAVEGSKKYTAVHDSAIYHFSSAENRDIFNANPDKYEPQFGGFCAYGAALGKKFDVDGEAFEVVDGKLYVNKSLTVYETWAEEKDKNIETAHTKWSDIENVAASEL